MEDFCLWVYKVETFCGSFIHHLAAMVQRTLQNSTKKFFLGTPTDVSEKEVNSKYPQKSINSTCVTFGTPAGKK